MYRSFRVVGRSSSSTTHRSSIPCSRSIRRTKPASKSRPTPPISRTSAPRARSIVATLAAPPSRCSRWSARNRGTGASWLIRSAIAPDVTVQDQVADHDDPRVAELLDTPHQIMRHPGSSMTGSTALRPHHVAMGLVAVSLSGHAGAIKAKSSPPCHSVRDARPSAYRAASERQATVSAERDSGFDDSRVGSRCRDWPPVDARACGDLRMARSGAIP